MTINPQALIRILNRLGIRLSVDGHYLICHGTRGKMTAELRQVIHTHKKSLYQALKG